MVSETPKVPAPVPDTAGRIQSCLKLASGQPAGAGYTMGFSINGVEKETRPTNANGCASLDVEIDLAARFQPVYAKSPSGESLVASNGPRNPDPPRRDRDEGRRNPALAGVPRCNMSQQRRWTSSGGGPG